MMRRLLALTLWAAFGCVAYGQGVDQATHDTDAAAYDRIVESKLKQTYPATAMRMLRECGELRSGVCIDIGCGTGRLDIELARRSNFKIIGLDINAEMRPFFERNVREAGLAERIRFVAGDAQSLPFPDDHADLIVSRGVIIFIPDLAKCLREVQRVLKPTGVAFLGGRYLYAPADKKMSAEQLRQIVRKSGVSGAEVVEQRGQWVKILGKQVPAGARKPARGPGMLAARCLADYGTRRGDCLLVCSSDNEQTRALLRGFLDLTQLHVTLLYTDQAVVDQARSRMQAEQLGDRVECRVGKIDELPSSQASYDLVVGAGPMLIFSADRPQAMRQLYRILRPGGVALVGGQFLHMPASRRVGSDTLRADARQTGISTIRVVDDMGQWVEIRK